jgi:hypothetical protein
MPSMEARSAGEVGCSPSEIMISDQETHLGLVQSGATWVAECRGRRFVCSQLNQSGDDKSILDEVLAADHVSCREEAESPEAEKRRRDAEAAALSAHAPPLVPAPTGAAGFDFGQTPEDAAHRCSAAGESWQGSGARYVCSGSAAPLGIAATIGLVFCGGHLCSISVRHVPAADFNVSAVSLKQNLTTKYGPARESHGTVPESCRGPESFARCAEARRVVLNYAWRWPGGESIAMSVGKLNEREPAAIRLLYRRSSHFVNMSGL